LLAGAGLLLALAGDFRRPAEARLSTRAALDAIHLYQATVSPLYARLGVHCRFTPTCSRYGDVVISRYGVVRGGWMAMRRLARCGPWTPMGTVDPPPSAAESRIKK